MARLPLPFWWENCRFCALSQHGVKLQKLELGSEQKKSPPFFCTTWSVFYAFLIHSTAITELDFKENAKMLPISILWVYLFKCRAVRALILIRAPATRGQTKLKCQTDKSNWLLKGCGKSSKCHKKIKRMMGLSDKSLHNVALNLETRHYYYTFEFD